MTDLIRKAITEHYGPRCRTADTDDFPELAGGTDRCPAGLALEQFDAQVAAARSAAAGTA
ncbi:hypothetical protein [Paracoccus sp. ME4]|uniref:hypothetical protein n=1 Tax=Paracoccus sp. ME4 TaxID=3138066 RepID=UPI00398AA031